MICLSIREAGLTVMLADDWNQNKVRRGRCSSRCLRVSGAAGGRSDPTVTGSALWVSRAEEGFSVRGAGGR